MPQCQIKPRDYHTREFLFIDRAVKPKHFLYVFDIKTNMKCKINWNKKTSFETFGFNLLQTPRKKL